MDDEVLCKVYTVLHPTVHSTYTSTYIHCKPIRQGRKKVRTYEYRYDKWIPTNCVDVPTLVLIPPQSAHRAIVNC